MGHERQNRGGNGAKSDCEKHDDGLPFHAITIRCGNVRVNVNL